MNSILIHNALIVNENRKYLGYIVISGKFIEEVAEGIPSAELENRCSEIIDAEGKMLIPGVIDDQVHFRDPGLTHKGDIETESRAAIAGGVTSFMDMPNTKPAAVTVEILEDKYKRAAEVSHANYSFFVGGTNTNLDTLLAVDYKKVCGVKLFLGSSTGNMLVDDPETISQIFEKVPALIAIHSEDETIINRNKEEFKAKYGDNLPVEYHPLIRSEEACYVCTERATKLARKYGTRLHVLHLSTARELELLDRDMPLSEKKITGEVCVHHMWFTDRDYAKYGNRIKCNPAIKTPADREALRQALNDDVLDIVATDHAPHLLSEKEGNCLTAASGMPLVQFSLLMMLEMALQGIFSTEKVIEKMCHAPAELYHVNKRGYLRPGYYADVVLVDPSAEYTVTADDVVSRCGWSPLEGTTFHSRVTDTFVNGVRVFKDGKMTDARAAERLEFDN